jgi:hypothetical protein
MHGLQFIDATEPGLADRLLGRKPKENAFIEINNIVASVPAAELTRDCIAERLEAHGITADEARPRLLSLYAQVLRNYIQGGVVTEEAAATLARLRELFGLNGADTGHVLAAIVLPFYERAAVEVLADRKLTDGEREYLETLVERLGIPPHVAREIYDRCARHVYHTALARHAATRRLSPEEEADLARLAADLNVVIRPGSHDEAILRRFTGNSAGSKRG